MKNNVINIAKKMNSLENIKKFYFHLPDGYSIIQNENNNTSNVVFIAKNDTSIIQFLTDGTLDENETFDMHVQSVVNQIVSEYSNNGLYDNDKFFFYLKDYNTKLFNFKLYVQDILVDDYTFIRQLNAYFIETNSKEFCQISLASGSYRKSEYNLLNKIDNLENDIITKKLIDNMISFLDKIEY